MMISILVFLVLGALLGTALGYASQVFKVESNPLVDQIESLMPGGQCGQCGEPGCRQAAEAMVRGELSVDCCPPGGSALASSVAEMLGVNVELSDDEKVWVASIDEDNCSGCTRCFKACPFDAIVGANKQIHTVISEVCTGCRLCSEACPQECLSMESVGPNLGSWFWPNPEASNKLKGASQ